VPPIPQQRRREHGRAAALPAAPQLLKLFDESTGGYRLDIGWTLVEIGADRQDVVDRLVPLILGTETEVWRLAGRLLAYASPEEGRRQVAALVPQLSFEQIAQQRYPPALHAVSGLAHVAQEAIPALTELLQRPLDDWSFQVAAAALGEMGPDAAPAVPILIRLLARDLSTLKLAQRRAVLASLGAMGSAARLAIPAILSELKSLKLDPSSTPDEKREREHCLATAIRVLELVGGADPNVLAALQMQLLGGNARAGNVALDALLELSPESPDLLPELLKRHWILAISRLTCDRHNAIGPLTEALRGTEPRARKAAAWVLGTLGPDATTALPALYEALSDWQNSLYEPRWAIYAPPDNGNRNEIFGGGASQRIWQSTFVPPFDEGQQFERSSVRDLVREAILKIDPQADFRDNGESNVESRQRQETDETRIRTGIRKIRV
jgi:HEAT repeat protein